MLEGLVAWVLNNYLGKYVENLNTDQLSIAILSGEVELENLPLRRDALRHLGIPVEIRAGHIGKIKLQIPIRALRSSPWVIVIERLYLVAGPLALDEWDQAAEELADQERKLAALDAIEACWRLEADGTVTPGSTTGGTYYASSYSSWLSYGTGVITDIVENMQLHVKDVHIRYEDATSLPGGGACACGLTIESLSAQSCDSLWQPQFTSHRDGSDLSFKTIELRNLAVYWDTVDPRTDHGLTSKLPPNELAAALTDSAEEHRFLVAPVSACARLQRNRNELPLRSAATPRIVCDLNLDQVPLTLVDWQYEQMVCCIRGLEFLSRVQQQRRQRPSVTIATDPKCWWFYAIGCHVPSVSRHRTCARTWAECLELAKQNVQYVDMYTRYLAQPSAALGAETKRLKDTVEWSRDFEELRALREVAMRRVSLTTTATSTPIFSAPTSPTPTPQTAHQSDDGRSVLVRWFPQWWGWYSTPTVTNQTAITKSENENIGEGDASSTNTTGSRQLEDEILEALADSAKNNTLLRRDVVFGKFNFTLNGGTFELCASNEIGAPGVATIELQFTELEAGIVSRPRSSSHGIELRLGSLCLRDRLTAGTLFPVLVGPPGARESRPGVALTPVGLLNVPRGQRCRQQHHSIRTPGSGGKLSAASDDEGGPLFSLLYEAVGSGVRRLHVRSRPIDVVYQPAVARWLVEFACAPHQRSAARHRLEEMRARTKQQLTDTWGSMLDGHQHQQRTTWDLRFDVSAPQLILVERFCDPAAAIAVVDLGTLHLENGYQHQNGQQSNFPQHNQHNQKQSLDEEEEDDDAFMTPCSTPPGSEAGDESIGDKISVLTSGETVTLVSALSELSLHQKLYDTYNVELCDIQVLVGRVRDNWRHAHTKGSSSLHVLDRFNIALQVERRIVPTSDPMYPSVTLAANLPRLVAHVNEQKISALRTLARVISDTSLPSPFNAASPAHNHEPPRPVSTPQSEDFPSVCTPRATSPNSHSQEPDELSSNSSTSEPYRLLTVQFTVDQMSLEVQSRGRSVAELQVSGVTAALHRRPFDLSISLTVHGLLLVDALQTFGPDFELLVASHRHVGMDSMSGSLRDSEPTSPTSPGSPDPGAAPRQPRATSPIALTKALSAVVSPLPPLLHAVDSEALISVEFVIVTGKEEAIQLASIQFNNLDIIANQETIVELVGFVRRVSPVTRSRPVVPPQPPPHGAPASNKCRERTTSASDADVNVDVDGVINTPDVNGRKQTTRTELTFDFHRLNVLLLRGTIEDGRSVGRKIGTATMSEARIQATVDSALFVRGSLGGLQVLDLTPEGHLHQRIISVGRDPLADETLPGFNFNTKQSTPPLSETEQTAFSFSVRRELHCDFNDEETVESESPEPVDVSIRMASVWYTHSPQFLSELRSCATEFKQYLADVARSIRSAATDVALGLVHARTEALAHSLYMNPRLAGLTAYDVQSPRRLRRRSNSTSEPHTPFTPYAEDDGEDNPSSAFGETDVQLDIVLDSPVLVLPRSSESCHVLVGHLGKITINNTSHVEANNQRTYTVEIRDMSICTLDTSGRRIQPAHAHTHGFHGTVPRADQLYGCEDPTIALPILHDTLVRLQVTKYAASQLVQMPTSILLIDDKNQQNINYSSSSSSSNYNSSLLSISGSVVNALRVSLTRAQYEQVLDTMQWLGKDESTNQQPQQSVQLNGTSPSSSSSMTASSTSQIPLAEITEEDVVGGVSTLSMDPHVRAKLFPSASRRARINTNYSSNYQNSLDSHEEPMRLSIRFQVASFEVELCGADGAGLVGLSFGDFLLTLQTPKIYETDLEVLYFVQSKIN